MIKKAWTMKNGKIGIRFRTNNRKHFNSMLNKVKDLPGRSYDSDLEIWTVPFTLDIIKKLKLLDFELSKKLKRKIKDKKVNKIAEYKDSLLRDYQIPHANKLVASIMENGGALDGSDTGTGKTYVAISIAKYLKLFPIVVTPVSVIPAWKDVARIFKCKYFALNYEQYRIGNTKYLSCGTEIRINKRTKQEVEVKKFTWDVPKNALLVFDEVHRCKDNSTLNSRMLESAADQDIKILCLSATVGDNPMHFYAVGRAIRMFDNIKEFMSWAFRRGIKKNPFGKYYFSKKARNKFLPKVHEEIYSSRGSRISIKDLGDKFPENTIITDAYSMGDKTAQQINRLYKEMKVELNKLRNVMKKDKSLELVAIMRRRQEIELLKVPTFVELAKDHIEEGMSVAIFVNFTETLQAIAKRLKTSCIIDGSVTGQQREDNRKKFQDDKERIIILNHKAGGVGTSLHDIRGEFPRIGLISPTYSAIDLIQTFGRLPRDGAKSKVLQKLIFCADTVEEDVAKKVSRKVKNIQLINDGDLL